MYTHAFCLLTYVLSQSVANALEFYGGAETSETKIFVQTFDTFFDCLNVRNLDEHRKKRKPNLTPYRSPDDERLTVSFQSTCVLTNVYLYLFSGWRMTSYSTTLIGRPVWIYVQGSQGERKF